MRRLLGIFIIIMLVISAASAGEREDLRRQYRSITDRLAGLEFYVSAPDAADKNTPGVLSEDAQALCLDYVNFLRNIAGLEGVSTDSLYELRAQNAAYLLSVNDAITHAPEYPQGMDAALYESAAVGARESCIAKFNWKRDRILLDGVDYYARDDGEENLSFLSHRRWLLDPAMARTGFGFASAPSGMSYTAMYAVDSSRAAEWDHVAWPCGTFPAELMTTELPWSISLNDELYDLTLSVPVITLERTDTGDIWRFDMLTATGDGVCCISSENYGSGSCLIFRPDHMDEYVQNMRFRVSVSGLVDHFGNALELTYDCDMISLYPQEVAAVELDRTEIEIRKGEVETLTAEVVPLYADDTTIEWSSSDPAIACVDLFGTVAAIEEGACTITACGANGSCDVCEVTVLP